jgi:hypothetical protein
MLSGGKAEVRRAWFALGLGCIWLEIEAQWVGIGFWVGVLHDAGRRLENGIQRARSALSHRNLAGVLPGTKDPTLN